MGTLDTAVPSAVTNVTVSPQPSVVTDIVTSNAAAAAPASAASAAVNDPQGTSAIQGNAPVSQVKVSIGVTQNATSCGAPSCLFSNPA